MFPVSVAAGCCLWRDYHYLFTPFAVAAVTNPPQYLAMVEAVQCVLHAPAPLFVNFDVFSEIPQPY